MADIAEATNSVRSLATDSYNAAAKRFVTKDFAGSLELVQPLVDKAAQLVASGQLSPSTASKAWVLYATLADASFNDFENWPRKQRRALSSKIAEGTIWAELKQSFGNSYANVQPDVVLSIANIVVKRNGDLGSSTSAIEEFLSLSDFETVDQMPEVPKQAYTILVRVFLGNVLGGAGEFDYAREFIESSSAFSGPERSAMMLWINGKEQDYKKKLADAASREQERVKEAKAQAQAQAQQLAQAQSGAEALTRGAQSQSQGSELSQASEKSRSPQPSRAVSRKSDGPRNIEQVYKHWISVLKRQSSTSILLFILLLLAAISNRGLRDRVTNTSRWLLTAIRQTMRMGLTVTYL